MRQFLAGFSPVPERSTKRKTFYIFTRKIFDNRKKISYNKNTVRTEPIRRQCDGLQKYPRGSRGSPAKGVASVTVARVQISSSAPRHSGSARRYTPGAPAVFFSLSASCDKKVRFGGNFQKAAKTRGSPSRLPSVTSSGLRPGDTVPPVSSAGLPYFCRNPPRGNGNSNSPRKRRTGG